MSVDEHEEVAGLVERAMFHSLVAISVCPFRCAAEIPMPSHSNCAMLRTASGGSSVQTRRLSGTRMVMMVW